MSQRALWARPVGCLALGVVVGSLMTLLATTARNRDAHPPADGNARQGAEGDPSRGGGAGGEEPIREDEVGVRDVEAVLPSRGKATYQIARHRFAWVAVRESVVGTPLELTRSGVWPVEGEAVPAGRRICRLTFFCPRDEEALDGVLTHALHVGCRSVGGSGNTERQTIPLYTPPRQAFPGRAAHWCVLRAAQNVKSLPVGRPLTLCQVIAYAAPLEGGSRAKLPPLFEDPLAPVCPFPKARPAHQRLARVTFQIMLLDSTWDPSRQEKEAREFQAAEAVRRRFGADPN